MVSRYRYRQLRMYAIATLAVAGCVAALAVGLTAIGRVVLSLDRPSPASSSRSGPVPLQPIEGAILKARTEAKGQSVTIDRILACVRAADSGLLFCSVAIEGSNVTCLTITSERPSSGDQVRTVCASAPARSSR